MGKFSRSLAVALMIGLWGHSWGQGLDFVETADGVKLYDTRDLVQWTHTRLVFNKDLERVAVGQNSTLEVEVLGSNEVLALAKSVGRTSIMVWYTDKTTETFLFRVIQDLTVLRRALRDVHPGIRLELAPDRAALVLRGRVPTVKFRLAAESVARNYLEVGNKKTSGQTDILVQSPAGGQQMNDANLRITTNDAAAERSAAIINLIQVEELPLSREETLLAAIRAVGGQDVHINRIQQGDLADNGLDTLTLTGSVENQIVLTRVLNIASRLFLSPDGKVGQAGTVVPIADESGGLLGQDSRFASSGSSLSGGGVGGGTDNNIRTNIARSKLISVAGGRILSMIEVKDLPQVRVTLQMHEVDRVRLKTWRPDLTAITEGYQNDNRFGISGATQQAVGASSVENALQLVSGAITNNLQIASGSYAFDLLFSLLEKEGISRTLSRPSLTVLAGETAVFRAGGEVPVPSAYAPVGIASGDTAGANTAGVFSGTEFKSFGIELRVRAMVGDDDRITLDVNPTVSLPDTLLTQQIAGSTGTSLNTAAFDVRSINTSTRLEDGQPMVIGGLVTRDISDDESYTPGLHSIPLLGRLAQSSSKGNSDRELIIVVTPTIVREPKHDAELWQFPDTDDLLHWAVALTEPVPGTKAAQQSKHKRHPRRKP